VPSLRVNIHVLASHTPQGSKAAASCRPSIMVGHDHHQGPAACEPIREAASTRRRAAAWRIPHTTVASSLLWQPKGRPNLVARLAQRLHRHGAVLLLGAFRTPTSHLPLLWQPKGRPNLVGHYFCARNGSETVGYKEL
jgi:hypothetical protein